MLTGAYAKPNDIPALNTDMFTICILGMKMAKSTNTNPKGDTNRNIPLFENLVPNESLVRRPTNIKN